jgi:RNA polymerase sigma-70 factor (ECF subfamily)
MRSLWEDFYKDLSRAATTHRAQSDFENLKTRRPELEPFQDPAQLLDHLSTPGLGQKQRDSLLRVLVQDAQVAGGSDSIAMRLLWLGLRTKLDGLYRGMLSCPRCKPNELVNHIFDHFTAQVLGADLARIEALAATLVRNTERDLKRELYGNWEGEAKHQVLLKVQFDLAAKLRETDEHECREWLKAHFGRDAGLLAAVLLDGRNLKEAAEDTGLTHANARKRFSEAMKSLTPGFWKKS